MKDKISSDTTRLVSGHALQACLHSSILLASGLNLIHHIHKEPSLGSVVYASSSPPIFTFIYFL